MKMRVLVQGTTVLACAALAGTAFLQPAQAAPAIVGTTSFGTTISGSAFAAPFAALPATPAIPSAEDIAKAKKSAATAAAASKNIDALILDANSRLQTATATSMSANNTYSDALVALGQRQAEAETAKAKATVAAKDYQTAKSKLGALAGNLYKTGGMNLDLQSFLTSSNADDTLYQASTLTTITADRSFTYAQAEAAASSSTSLQKQAAAAQSAADQAAQKAEQSKTAAQSATDAQAAIVKTNTDQRTVLLGQLATLNNTTASLESARVDGLAKQAEEAALAAQIKASEDAPKPVAPVAPVTNNSGGGSSGGTDQSSSNGGSGGSNPVTPVQPPAVTPPVTTPPVTTPPVTTPPVVVVPPVVTPPVVKPPVVTPPVVTPPTGNYTQVMVNFAMSKIGSPYWWGGTGPGYDCSGLVYKAFAAAGKSVPRTGSAQFWAAPVRVPLSQMQYGDLLVFNDDGAGNFTHIAIYIGGGQVVQALNPTDGVTVTPLSWMSGMALYPYAARY